MTFVMLVVLIATRLYAKLPSDLMVYVHAVHIKVYTVELDHCGGH